MRDAPEVRKLTLSEEPNGPASGGISPLLALAGVCALSLLGFLTPGIFSLTVLGIHFLAGGLLMVLLPPRARLPWIYWSLAAAIVLFCSLPLLPSVWAAVPLWRPEVTALGLDTGTSITPHPLETREYLARMGFGLLMALYILGHRVNQEGRFLLAFLFTACVAVYALVSMGARNFHVAIPGGDPGRFGFFANRNHTATLLVMGFAAGLGVIVAAFRTRGLIWRGMALMPVLICIWAAVAFSISRAGVLLMGVVFLAWLALLGSRYYSKALILLIITLLMTMGGLFLHKDSGVGGRLRETAGAILGNSEELGANGPDIGLVAGPAPGGDVPFDGRVSIFQDTLTMIAGEPWTGVGFGLFRHIFPQYREYSFNDKLCLHPESDWLWMAAEAGIPATILLMAGVALLFIFTWRTGSGRSGWPLRLGCLLAAMVLPLHGIFDVPGHSITLSLFALVAMALAMPHSGGSHTTKPVRRLWRIAGSAVCFGGIWLLRGAWFGGPVPEVVKTGRLAHEAMEHYDKGRDLFRKAGGAVEPAALEELRQARDSIDSALATAPLHGQWRYMSGTISLYLPGGTANTDRQFALQRRLYPSRVDIYLKQASAWSTVNQKKTFSLWEEALLLTKNPIHGKQITPSSAMRLIVQQAGPQESSAMRALELAGDDPDLLPAWAKEINPRFLNAEMPGILGRELPQLTKNELFAIWFQRGTRRDVMKFAETGLEYQDLLVPL